MHTSGRVRRLFVVKIGGAALTHKGGYCEPNAGAVKQFVERVAEVWAEVRAKLVVVIGGGSFGNAIPKRYGLIGPGRAGSETQRFRMTSGMFRWASIVSEALAERGVPAYPFQLGALATTDAATVTVAAWGAIDSALAGGMLPVLTGDLVLSPTGCAPRIISSDDVPELLAGRYELARVVFRAMLKGSISTARTLVRWPAASATVTSVWQ